MKQLPNIYEVLDSMDFEKVCEEVEDRFKRLDKSKMNDEARKYNREQIVFSVVQRFYDKVLIDQYSET